MIAIVDTGGANHASIQYALQRLNVESIVTLDKKKIRTATHVILPGVGHAKFAMQKINQSDLFNVIHNLKQPVLGICLGMQMLFEYSEEGETTCLGLLPGRVKKIITNEKQRVPNMGWSELNPKFNHFELLNNITTNEQFYFVHSYIAPSGEWIKAETFASDQISAIPAILEYKNFTASQFHPERSSKAGLKFLDNFLKKASL